jgi:anti-sigma factor RsiW
MGLQPRPAICERARAWVSLRLDGELSELEDALLGPHLRGCAQCRAYEATVRGAVQALRREPFELLDHPVALPTLRRAALRPAGIARVAAAVAAVVGLATVLSSQPSHSLPATPSPRDTPGGTSNSDLVQARAIRVVQLGAVPRWGQSGVRGAVLVVPRSGL